MSSAVASAPRPRSQVRFRLSVAQKVVFRSLARFRVLVAGRRFGKSYLACVLLLTEAWKAPDRVCWYVAPTYRQGKQILWALLKRIVPASYVRTVNETDLAMLLVNGSVIAIRGADNPSSLRGVGLDFAVLDEFAYIPRGIWDEVIRPALADRQGAALFVTTPSGLGWDYDLYLAGQEQRDGFQSWTFTTLEGGNVDPAEVEAARSAMDPRTFRQEFEASFETLSGRVYDQFQRAPYPSGNMDASVTDQPTLPLLVGMDFNVHPMSLVLGVQAADELHVFDALEIPTSNTSEVAAELRRRYPTRPIIVCPDPSGKARKTSAGGETDFTILQRAGCQVDAPNAAPGVADRVNAVQAMLCDGTGRRRLRIHPKAACLIRAFDGLTYKPGTSIPDKASGLDHVVDAAGYLVWQRFNRLRPSWASTRVVF